MRLRLLVAAAMLLLGPPTRAEEPDDSLRLYAVNVVRDPPQEWPGQGVYLGHGLVLSAAHVVGLTRITRPTVRIAGLDLPAETIKEGTLDRVDLTLLLVDEQKLPVYLRMRRLSLCDGRIWPGQPVLVVVPDAVASSQVMSPALLPRGYDRQYTTVIKDVATTGNSGSGVFDAGQKCLLGIISRKIYVRRKVPGTDEMKQIDIAKYFVPAPTIAAFLPAGHRL